MDTLGAGSKVYSLRFDAVQIDFVPRAMLSRITILSVRSIMVQIDLTAQLFDFFGQIQASLNLKSVQTSAVMKRKVSNCAGFHQIEIKGKLN